MTGRTRVGVLARNEGIKARGRPAFWVGLLGFAGLMGLFCAGMLANTAGRPGRALTLPRAWAEVISGPGSMAVFFTAIILILLVSSEFTWRTARQNVIDGLSKEEFFAAKLLLVPALTVLFFATLLVIAGGFGLAGSRMAGTTGPWIRGVDAAFMGGALVGLLGWGALAFLLATTVRSSGPAVGIFFLYLVGEQVASGLLRREGGAVAAVSQYLPVSIFQALWDAQRYGAAPRRLGRPLGQPPDLEAPVLVAAGAAYAVVFVGLAFALYRRRDL